MTLFLRPVVQQAGLRRADVPGADKRPLEALQPAARGANIAAMVALPAYKLLLRGRDAGQVEKEKIPEVGPYPGPLTADVRAVGAGAAAQLLHEGKERFQQAPSLPGLSAAIGKGRFMVVDGFCQAGVGFLPPADGVPGDERFVVKHGIANPDEWFGDLHLREQYSKISID